MTIMSRCSRSGSGTWHLFSEGANEPCATLKGGSARVVGVVVGVEVGNNVQY